MKCTKCSRTRFNSDREREESAGYEINTKKCKKCGHSDWFIDEYAPGRDYICSYCEACISDNDYNKLHEAEPTQEQNESIQAISYSPSIPFQRQEVDLSAKWARERAQGITSEHRYNPETRVWEAPREFQGECGWVKKKFYNNETHRYEEYKDWGSYGPV
jgi:hypothetical protein